MQIRNEFLGRQQELVNEIRDFVLLERHKGADLLGWGPTHRTLRIAATTFGLWYDWRGAAPLDLIDLNTVPKFEPIDQSAPLPVSLVVLAASRSDLLHRLLDRHATQFHDVVVMLDQEEATSRIEANVRFHSRPLSGDFSAQRNAGNGLAKGAWVFHLDTDETLQDGFCSVLSPLAGAADRAGLSTVGFPRRNFVDGKLSDLFPDVQYRLMRQDVRFENRVHERPEACRVPGQTMVSQHGTIDHYLQRTRVQERSEFYDKLGQDAERHGDDAALLTPFQPQ